MLVLLAALGAAVGSEHKRSSNAALRTQKTADELVSSTVLASLCLCIVRIDCQAV